MKKETLDWIYTALSHEKVDIQDDIESAKENFDISEGIGKEVYNSHLSRLAEIESAIDDFIDYFARKEVFGEE